jgi:hypothetical protein
MENLKENEYDTRICRIIDAKHYDEVGTDEDPAYSQSIRLLLLDSETGATFVAPLSEQDVKEICQLDFDLHSKDMIEIAEKLRDWEGDIKLLVPKKSQKVTKDLLLNTPTESADRDVSYRKASVTRFKFNKEKIKKG